MRGPVSAVVRLAAAAGAVLLAWPAAGAVTLPPVFSHHMVLQQGISVPVWGEAAPGEEVAVTFQGQTRKATADTAGKWMLRLDPLKASAQPADFVVSGSSSVTLTNVLVGEVWVGSGQSNMAMAGGSYAKGDPVLAAAIAGGPYPTIRLLSGSSGPWREATPQTVPSFSALLFSFGFSLQRELNVPVGLIVGAVGGTPSVYWLSEAALKDAAACQKQIAAYAASYDGLRVAYEEKNAKWAAAAEAAKASGKPAPPAPVAPAAPGVPMKGQKVGYLFEAHIRPVVPFAIRGVLWDQGESGTQLGGVDQYTLMGALIGGWRREWGQGDFPFVYVQKPSGGGCAWDPSDLVTRCALPFAPVPARPMDADGPKVEDHVRIMTYTNTAMAIASDLGGGVHPVNKSGYGARAARVALGLAYGRPVEYSGPEYRSHAVEGGKVRIRFAHVGQGLAFRHGEKLQGFALAGPDGTLQWADARIIEPAGGGAAPDTVELSCAAVPAPAVAWYAWTASRPWANLFNRDGLPAVPFRVKLD